MTAEDPSLAAAAPAGPVALGLPTAELALNSFDGGVSERCKAVRPDRYRDLERLPRDAVRIVRGGGFSFAAAAFGGGALVQDFTRFDRILAFDPVAGWLRCEAGATLGKVFATAVGAGWYLPIQPGHPDLSVGGCLAADAHGKNPSRDGAFRRQVAGLTLYHPRYGSRAIGPAADGELFELTCGGYGLTGHIVDVTLQLHRAPACFEVRRLPATDLLVTAELLSEWASRSALLYSWNDLAARGHAFGRGFVTVGTAVAEGGSRSAEIPASAGGSSLRYQRLPEHCRGALPWWNRWSSRSFNRVYAGLNRSGRAQRQRLFDVLFPIASKATYFKLFGPGGMLEYQVLVPLAAFPGFVAALARGLGKLAVVATLGSCKLFDGESALVRFDGRGIAVAIDLPRRQATPRLLDLLDGLTADSGSIPNLIKDSRLPAELVARCYPGYEEFRRRLREHDPERLYRSELSQRLDL